MSDVSLPALPRVAAEVEFNVLGPVTVVDAAGPLQIGGPKQRTVLAVLIAHVGNSVSNDVLAEAVYGEDVPERGRRRVQTYISTLRSVVGDVISRESSGWVLRSARDNVDALRFEDLYESVRSDPDLAPESAGRLLREALSIWRGHPYSDIEAYGLLDPEVTRLQELRVAAQMARIDADLASGRHDDLIGEIEGLIFEHPYQERLRAQHMLALYRAGRQREALRSFQQLRTLLVDELGVDPTPDLRDLEQRILEQDDSLDLTPRRQIERKAILVADLGDPLELARLKTLDREHLLATVARAIAGVADEPAARLIPAGMASYAVFDSVPAAVSAAVRLTDGLGERGLRVAIDFGDVEVSDDGVTGAPVSRSAVLVGVANPGQVLLSPDAQHAVLSAEESAGMRFESLGRFALPGIQDPIAIYQLLVGDPPKRFPPIDPNRIPPPIPDGMARALPGYELREQVGTGSLGPIYRAYQPAVGREVMVEMVGRAEASDPGFIRSFEADAQRLALLDHPNINTLLDYWRDPGGAFLVYRHHRGGFLSDAGVPDPRRLVAQIGSALDYAHSYGLIHGSVRPDRIALDESGNGYLMGFPIAQAHPPSSPDYAAYIAPETLAGEEHSTATDVFALGILAHELLSGDPATADEPIRPKSRAVSRAISERPDDRQETVAQLLRELLPEAVGPDTRFTAARNPYKGLSAFGESDSGEFFGRSVVIGELVESLRRSQFLVVVGPSGIGKSSLVRAGLVPALRRGTIEGSESWLVTDMLPGSHPFHELSRALERVAVNMPADVREQIAEEDPDALAGLDVMLPAGTELLILIDQFEELFTMTTAETAGHFLALLTRTIEAGRARIVITLRADFLDRPLLYSEFGEMLRESMIAVRAPNAVELREAIVKPAEGVGIRFEAAVVERMISEVHERPGALPLLQDALFELFDSRTSDTIGPDSYESIGGVTGSIARRAEAIYTRLDSEEQASVRQAFLRLVTVIEDASPTRRRTRLSDLDDLGGRDAVDVFARNRLLVYDSDPITRAPTVEVAHETLLTHWPRFAVWVDEAREDLVLSRRLDEAIQEWEATGRRPAYLLTGARLAQHRAWVTTTSFGLTERQQLFLAASARHDDELRIRSRRRRAWIIGGFATAALVAVVFGLAALGNARRASVEAMASSAVVALETDPELAVLLAAEAFDRAPIASAQKALHQALQGQRASMIIPPPDGALGAWGIVDPAGEHVAVVGLDTARLQMWEIGADQPMWETTLSDEPDAGFRSWAHFWFSADGSRVYVPLSFKKGDSAGLGLYTIDADSGETLDFLRFPCLARAMPAGGHFAEPGSLWAFDWGGVGKDATCGGWKVGGGVGVVDIDTGQTHFKVRMDVGPPPSLSEDGRYLGVGGWFGLEEQARARVFDTMSGEMVFDFDSELSQGETNSVLSRDGSRVLVGRNPSYLYDVATGERLQTYQGGAIRIRFTPDEQRVFATGVGTSIEVFDTESGAELLTLRGHTSWVADAAVDLEGSVLVSSSFDSVRVWDVASSMRSELSPVDLPPITGGLFLRDALTGSSQHLLVRRAVFDRFVAEPEPGNQPQVVAIVDTVDGSVSNHDVWHAELGPNGVLFVQPVVETDVATPSGVEGAVRIGPPLLVDTATGRRIVELSGCDWYWSPAESVEPATDCGGTGIPQLSDVSFAADGSTVLGGTVDGAIMIWDAETGEVLKSFEPTFPGSAAALYPDGRHMIREEDPEEPFMKVRDVITGAEVGTVDGYAAHTTQAPIHILEYHAAANLVIGAGTDLLLIDPDTLDVTVLTTGDWSEDVAVSPDGHLLATVGRDELVVVWDLDRMAIVAEIPVAGAETHGLRGVAFVDDETLVVAPASEDQLLRFTLNPEVLKDLALDSLNRGFQPEECATYDVDPCPSLDEMKARS